jgi:hypothetical protein
MRGAGAARARAPARSKLDLDFLYSGRYKTLLERHSAKWEAAFPSRKRDHLGMTGANSVLS